MGQEFNHAANDFSAERKLEMALTEAVVRHCPGIRFGRDLACDAPITVEISRHSIHRASWSDSNIRFPSAEPRLRMLESKDHWQTTDASGALDLTFA